MQEEDKIQTPEVAAVKAEEQPHEQEISMFDEQPSVNKSTRNAATEDLQKDDVPATTIAPELQKENSSNEQQDDETEEKAQHSQHQEHFREELSPHHSQKCQSHSAAQDTEVTDEKLFLESNGFGEPKHRTQDFEDEEDDSAVDQDQPITIEPINIAVITTDLETPTKAASSDGDALDMANQHQQALPFFDKRANSNSRAKKESQAQKQDYGRGTFNPAASVGFKQDPFRGDMRNSNAHNPEQSRTMTTLAALNSKPQVPLQNKKGDRKTINQTPYRLPRHQSQNKLGQQGPQPLPSLVKPNTMNQSRSISTFGKTFPVTNQQPQVIAGSIPNKLVARKNLHQKLQIRQAYSKSSMNNFIEKGAFGGAMQEIFQDQVNAQMETHDASLSENKEVSEKKARRKQRLNQILTAASKGRHTIKPSIEVEEVAHQYHNLKIDYNKIKNENSRMKTRLTKLSQQASKHDDKMISLNQELFACKLEQSQAFPMAAVEQHRFPDYYQDDNESPDNIVTLNPIHPTLFQSQMSQFGGHSTLQAKGSRSPSQGNQMDANMAKLEKSGLVLSLKKQVNELRKESEKSQQEIADLQKSTKVCVYNELDIQLETYADECKRLREKLEESVQKSQDQEKQIKKLKNQFKSGVSIQKEGNEGDTFEKQNDDEDGKFSKSKTDTVVNQDEAKSTKEEPEATEGNQQQEQYALPNDSAAEDNQEGTNSEQLQSEAQNKNELETPVTINKTESDEVQEDLVNKDAAEEVKDHFRGRKMQQSIERSPLKDKSKNTATPLPAKVKHNRTTSMQKRFVALNDNVRSKNLQITELNRQLKASNEAHQKQFKVLNKKNRELQANQKILEKNQLKKQPEAISESQEAASENADEEALKPVKVKDLSNSSNKPIVKKVVKKKAKSPTKSPAKGKNNLIASKKEPLVNQLVKESDETTKVLQTLEDVNNSQTDHYSNQSFDSEKAGQSFGGGGDVSTVKKGPSEVDINFKEEGANNKSHGYTSIDDDAMEDEVEQQFQKSIRSASIASAVQIKDQLPVSERGASSIDEDKIESLKDSKVEEIKSERQSSQQIENFKKASSYVPLLVKKESEGGQQSKSKASKNEKESLKAEPVSEDENHSAYAVGTIKRPTTEMSLASASQKEVVEVVIPQKEKTKHSNLSLQAGDSLVNEPSIQSKQMQDGTNSANAVEVNAAQSSNAGSKHRSVKSEVKNIKVSAREQLLKDDGADSEEQDLQIQDDANNEHLQEIRADEITKKTSAAITANKPKPIRNDSSPQNIQLLLTDNADAEPQKQVQAMQDLKEEDGERISDEDGQKVSVKSTSQKPRRYSENMLGTIDSEKQPLEGQSCGRNEDSEITSAQNESNQDKQVSEEQMLDIAENILRELAEKLLESDWSVKDVFDHPKLVHVIPSYDNVENVVAISAQNFLGRMYQIGFQEITQLQVACIMRVLGKYDLENAILFEDLMTLLENYGVPGNRTNQNASLDKSNTRSELPIATGSPRPTTPEQEASPEKKPSDKAENVAVDDAGNISNQNSPEKDKEDKVEEDNDLSKPEHPLQPDQSLEVKPEAEGESNREEEMKNAQSPIAVETQSIIAPEEVPSRENVSASVQNKEESKQSPAVQQKIKEIVNEESKVNVNNENNQNVRNEQPSSIEQTLARKQTRRDSIHDRVRQSLNQECAYSKLRNKIVSFSTNLETLMDIFRAKSYKQNIKSKSRQSETLVIQKHDFFELISSMLNSSPLAQVESGATSSAAVPNISSTLFTAEETNEIEHCIQLTPKFPTMYAVRHIETLFQALIETSAEVVGTDADNSMCEEESDGEQDNTERQGDQANNQVKQQVRQDKEILRRVTEVIEDNSNQ